MSVRKRRAVWIALAEVEQRPGAGVLLDENKAFTNVLALASTRQEFRRVIKEAFDSLGFDLTDLENPEPLRARLRRATVDDDLLALAQEVERDGRPRVGTFHTWTRED